MAEAARRLHMAPSAISMSIAELERIVGSDLAIKRRAKGLTLTATGRTVLQQARTLLELAAELESLGQGDRASLRGPLTVGCFMTLGPTIIPTMLSAFAEQCPQVEVDFVEGYHAEMQQALLDGSIDVAFLYGAEVSPALRSAPLTVAEPYVLVSTDHRLVNADSITLQDIAGDPLVLFDAEPVSRRILGLYEHAGVAPVVRHRSRSYATVRSLVGSGRGVAVLFQQPALEAPYQELRVVLKRLRMPRQASPEPVPVSVAWPRSTQLNARAQAWIEVASELFNHAAPPA